MVLVKQLFERAIKDHPQELEVWEAYLEFLVSRHRRDFYGSLRQLTRGSANVQHKPLDAHLREICERAIRNLPAAVALWTTSLRIAVRSFPLGSLQSRC